MAEELTDIIPETIAGPPPRKPFTGFVHRMAAFVLDYLTLYLVAMVLARVARPLLLGLNPWLPYFNPPLVFLYFWLGGGPRFEGRTAGRLIMRLHVVDAQGLPITGRAAARRALLKTAAMMTLMINPYYYRLGFPPEMAHAVDLSLGLLTPFCITLLITEMFLIGMHPYKRALHDLWAGSYVTWNPTPATFFQALSGEPEPVVARKLVHLPRMALMFWLIASIALVVKPAKQLTDPQLRRDFTLMAQLQRQAAPPTYLIDAINVPAADREAKIVELIQQERERQRRVPGANIATTESLRRELARSMHYDAKDLIVKMFRVHGAYSPEELNSTAFRQSMEKLRWTFWQAWQERRGKMKLSADAEAREALFTNRQFLAQLVEPLQVLLYTDERLRANVTGPADPAVGPLTFEEVHEPHPLLADRATTDAEATTATTVNLAPPATGRIDGSTTPTTAPR